MNYNEYIKILENEVFNLDKSLLDNIEVKHLAHMLYKHITEIETTNLQKHILKDLIRNS